MSIQNRQPNQVHLEFNENKNSGSQEVILDKKKIGMIHGQVDNPKASFDLVIEDKAGNEKFKRVGCQNDAGRWGERIDLDLTDNYYNVRIENVKGAKTVDLFLE